MEKTQNNIFWRTGSKIFQTLFFEPKWDSYKVGIAFILAGTLLAFNLSAAEGAKEKLAGLAMLPMETDQPAPTAIKPGIPNPINAILLESKIDTVITGLITRTRVLQTFVNESNQWMEGVYRFPLPDAAFVDRMRLKIGERVIVSQIKEKKQARDMYRRAAAAGKRAALLDQIRPNMFTTRIANIEPGGTIAVEITFQSLAGRDGAGFTWRMPQAITPRYRSPYLRADDTENPPLGTEREIAKPGGANPTAFRILIKNSTDLQSLSSPTHDIDIKAAAQNDSWITLANGEESADRDFVLRWQFAAQSSLKPYLFKETRSGEDYILGIIQPPAYGAQSIEQPRNVTFIIDVSGSMEGIAMEQARIALLHALSLLRPEDRFDIIAFNNITRRLFGQPASASERNLAIATEFVRALDANGGTEMYPALASALSDSTDDDHLRQILFLTDGAVSNERAMFDLVRRNLNGARLFTVGLGNAPNGWFMRKAAEVGHGIHIQVDNLQTAKTQLEALFQDMSRPWAQDIKLTATAEADIYPKKFADLFGARPIIFALRQPAGNDVGEMTARLPGGKTWHEKLVLENASQDPAISKFWARRKVEALLDTADQGTDRARVRDAVLKVALSHQILSPYTSFVAVDKTPVRPKEMLQQRPPRMQKARAATAWQALHGPKTATPLYWHLLWGSVILLLALVIFRWRRGIYRGVRP